MVTGGREHPVPDLPGLNPSAPQNPSPTGCGEAGDPRGVGVAAMARGDVLQGGWMETDRTVARGQGTTWRSMGRAVRVVRGAGEELVRLLVPLACGGCGAVDVSLCPSCAALLAGARRVESGAPRLDRLGDCVAWPVVAAGDYAGRVREVVVGWKDRGRADLTADLTPAVRHLASELFGALRQGTPPGQEFWVVPVPSTAGARRRRGREPVTELARIVAAEALSGCAQPTRARRRVRLVRALVHVRSWGAVRDQVGLGVRARSGNLSGSIDVRPRHRAGLDGQSAGQAPVACVLVDDVLTTGATLAECARAISRRGGIVVGAIVLAATPAPGSRGSSPGASVQASPHTR